MYIQTHTPRSRPRGQLNGVVCICMCMYIHTRVYIHTHIYVYVCVYTYICPYRPKPEADELGCEFVTEDVLFREADFVVPMFPLNDATKGLV